MSKASKVKILEAFCIRGKSGEVQDETVFKVQLRKGQEPINMLYNQLKHSYPEVLIDFYERQFRDEEQSDQEESDNQVKELFDYDTHLTQFGSKILEHINSFTLSFKGFDQNLKNDNPTGSERVFEQQANRFHKQFIQKMDQDVQPISRPIVKVERTKINPHEIKREKHQNKREKTVKSKKK